MDPLFCSSCLFLCQDHAVFITVALEYFLKSAKYIFQVYCFPNFFWLFWIIVFLCESFWLFETGHHSVAHLASNIVSHPVSDFQVLE